MKVNPTLKNKNYEVTLDGKTYVNHLEESSTNLTTLEKLNNFIRSFRKSNFKKFNSLSKPSETNRLMKDIDLSDVDSRLLQNPDYKFKLYYKFLGPKYNYIYSFVRSSYPKNMQIGLDNVLRSLNNNYTEKDFLNLIKDFGTYLLEKIINDKEDLYLYYFVELHYVAGYDTYHHRSYDMYKDCEPFLKKRRFPKEYKEIYLKNVRSTIDKIQFKYAPNARFDDWVRFRDNWAIMGSSNIGKKLVIETPGFKDTSKINSKFTNTLLYTDEQLLKMLHEYRPHEIRPFLKDNESAKARIVIGYDTLSYIRCSFLEGLIRNFNNGEDIWTSVGFNPDKLFSVRTRFDAAFKDPNEKLVCTDQSAFDQHQYKEMFIYAFEYLCKKMSYYNPCVKEICELELYGLRNAYFNMGNVHRRWENGLCSGHKFTALIGSILNRAASLTAADISNNTKYINYSIFQGDDATMVVNNKFKVKEFLEAYGKLDMVVNPMKTWNSDIRTEYLHQLYIEGQVYALPIRACLGMLFKDPQTGREIPDQKFISFISELRQASRRGCYVEKILKHWCQKYFSKYSKNIKFSSIYSWLHTPAVLGGGGFLPYVNDRNFKTLNVEKETSSSYKPQIVSHYGYQVNGLSKQDTSRYILKHVYDNLPAPNIKTRFSLFRVRFSRFQKKETIKLARIPSSYSYDLQDNSNRWLQHVLELIGDAVPFKDVSRYKFTKFRKVKETFSLTDSFSDWLVSKQVQEHWRNHLSDLREQYFRTKVSILKILFSANYVKSYLMKLNRSFDSSLTNYCLFF